jgi:hypothetical protein
MSTPFVKGPFSSDKFKSVSGEYYHVSLNASEHDEDSIMCQRVRDGHFLWVKRDHLTPTPVNLFSHDTSD